MKDRLRHADKHSWELNDLKVSSDMQILIMGVLGKSTSIIVPTYEWQS